MIRPRATSLLTIIPSCIALGAVPALLEFIFGSLSPRQFGIDVLGGAVYSLCIGIPCWLVLQEVGSRWGDKSLGAMATATVVVLGFFGAVGCGVAVLILSALHILNPAHLASTYVSALKLCLVMTFTFGIMSLIVGTLQGRLAAARQELHVRQMAEERERKLAAEARFASLESRVRPHFLFNTLNSISALVREDPAEAELMIERLAALLRSSLDSEASGVVPLREELRIVRAYLSIEKVRFGDRLRFRFEVEPASETVMVPALSIQTLVENSMKFAVGARREGAEIVVAARFHSGRLRVEVSDDGPGFEPSTSMKPGHGLDLLTRRLDALFGAAASLEMSAAGGRTMAVLYVAS